VALVAEAGESHAPVLEGGGNLLFVTLISIVSAMGGFLFGYETVVIAGTISLVKAQFLFSALMEGWFVSSGLLGCVAGVVAAGTLCDRIGRKGVMMLSGALLAAAAVGCAFAPAASWLIAARFTGGIGVGLASIVSPLYISEVAPSEFRGRLVSLFQLTITVGIVAAMLINAELLRRALGGAQVSGPGLWDWLLVGQVWRGMFLGQVVPAVLFFAFAMMVPESPRWLVLRGKPDRARTVLARLRGNDQSVSDEFGRIQAAVCSEERSAPGWRSAGLSRPLFLGVFLAIFSELSGITVVMYYGPIILEHAGATAKSSLNGHAIIGIVLAAFTLLAVWLVDRVGRRRLLLTGIAGACAALLLTGVCFAIGVTDGVAIVALLCAFVAFFAFSLGPIKWIVISEIFPTRWRARAMGVATVALWFTDIVINQLFPIVRDHFGISVMFFACALFLVIQFAVVARKLPETKGMALEEIVSLWK
jgi:sugar porter (SP) family MFS transporter